MLSLATMASVVLAFQAAGDVRFVEHALATIPDGVEVDGAIEFAPDGSQVAYVGKQGGRSVPVIGDKVGEAFEFVDPPVFGARGDSVAFRVGKRTSPKTERWWVLLGGKKTAENDWIGALAWSPDGSKLAYWTQPGAKIGSDGAYTGGDLVLVIDGKKGAKWDDADALMAPRWSRDSKQVVSSAMKNGEWCVIVGDKVHAKAGLIDGPIFSPDGKRVAYATVKEMDSYDESAPPPLAMSWVVVCEKKRYGERCDSSGSPVFSPNGKRIAYKAAKNGMVGVAVDDDQPEGAWSCVSEPVWSSDGKLLAYAAAKGAEIDPNWLVTREGAWSATGGAWQLVVDGKPAPATFDGIRELTASPDGRSFACCVRKGAKWRVVCGEKQSDEFDQVGAPVYDETGERLAFGVRDGRSLAWKVLALR